VEELGKFTAKKIFLVFTWRFCQIRREIEPSLGLSPQQLISERLFLILVNRSSELKVKFNAIKEINTKQTESDSKVLVNCRNKFYEQLQ
jgi:hypothetical protein